MSHEPLSNMPNHAAQRALRARKIYGESIKHLIDTVDDGGNFHSPIVMNIYEHDIMQDVNHLSHAAARWHDHCRKTGQNPFLYTNEDGTPDIESKTDPEFLYRETI